jgi:hypothetical protein
MHAGKSAIHGWGAFCKVPHTQGEMLTEYVGELVRPAVADARERNVYNSLVGAGTYVFALNAEHCVDATRKGVPLSDHSLPSSVPPHPSLSPTLFCMCSWPCVSRSPLPFPLPLMCPRCVSVCHWLM